jgi:hypothetical protein
VSGPGDDDVETISHAKWSILQTHTRHLAGTAYFP